MNQLNLKIAVTACALSISTGCAATPETNPIPEPGTTPSATLPSGVTPEPEPLPNLSTNSTLQDYLAYGALNNPDLKAAFHRWKAALQKLPQARSLPDPKFNYGYYIREVETRVGPQQHRVGLAQMFPWFGTLKLRRAVASAEADATQLHFESAKLKLFFKIKEAYYELYYLRQAIAITEDNIQLLKHLESVAQTRFRGGAPITGVVKAQLELSQLSDRLLTLTELRHPITAKLNAALSRPANQPLPWPQSFPTNSALVDPSQLAASLHDNPELKGLDALILKEDRATALARKAYYPDLTVGLDYIQTGDALNPSVPDNSKDPLVAQFSVSLPLWTGKYRAGVEEARARGEAARQSRRNRENLLAADLQMALYRFQDAERKINLYRNTLIPQAQGALQVAQSSYEAGKTDFLNLIDAQRLLLQFELETERAFADREQKLAEIEMLIGRELPRSTPTAKPTP